MSSIVDVSDRIARFTDGNSQTHFWWKNFTESSITFQNGRLWSYWTLNGKPGAGSTPGATSIPTRATAGALALVNPSGGRQKWLMYQATHGSAVSGSTIYYDRLSHCGGLSGTSTSVQTPAAAALTRYTNGSGNRIFVEVYSVLGATNTTAIVNYVNQDGNAAVSPSFTFVSSAVTMAQVGAALPVPFADGDTGVRSVTSITLSNSTGTAGNFGLTIGHILNTQQLVGSNGGTAAAILEGVEVLTDACLGIYFQFQNQSKLPGGSYILGEK